MIAKVLEKREKEKEALSRRAIHGSLLAGNGTSLNGGSEVKVGRSVIPSVGRSVYQPAGRCARAVAVGRSLNQSVRQSRLAVSQSVKLD